jgi:hypothetical protein
MMVITRGAHMILFPGFISSLGEEASSTAEKLAVPFAVEERTC